MSRLLEFILNPRSKPVKRNSTVVVTPDPDTGQVCATPVEETVIMLSPEGSIDTVRVVHDRVYHCGCNAQKAMGGRCIECRMVSCIDCFGRCARCSRPLCLEHSRFVQDRRGVSERLCRRCGERKARQQTAGAVLKGLLLPFLSFEEERGPR